MTSLCSKLLKALDGRTFSTAESCTGGEIGAAFTEIPGSSAVYKGGIISYTNWVKENILDVDSGVLCEYGAVSSETAREMAAGVRRLMQTDMAVSVTGIAGPASDERGTPVGTVYIGFAAKDKCYAKKFVFPGNRAAVRHEAVQEAINILICECAED